MRVVLATVGTRGDVQPMLAIAQALARRGHVPVVACPESFATWVRSLDIEHAALGEDLSAMIAGEGGPERSASGMARYFAEQMAIQAPRLLEIARGADAIVSTAMAWMAPSVAEKLGIAALAMVPSTAAFPSRLHPPPMMPWASLGSWGNGLLWWLSEVAQDRLMGSALNGARASIGLASVASFTKHLFVDTPCVVAADEDVLPPDPAWEGRYPYAGFLFLDDPAPLDPALDAWLVGDPPVYVGFGSMAGAPADRVGGVLRDAIAATGRRCLVASGSAKLFARSAPPDGVFVVREAPHRALFPRVAVVVHHGGSGTTAAALRAGVPQVILPLMLDQFHHARILAHARLAPVAPSMAKVTATTLARAIDQSLALPAEPRAAIATRLEASDAGAAITTRLERMVAASRAARQ